jgi:hypothetical protein
MIDTSMTVAMRGERQEGVHEFVHMVMVHCSQVLHQVAQSVS